MSVHKSNCNFAVAWWVMSYSIPFHAASILMLVILTVKQKQGDVCLDLMTLSHPFLSALGSLHYLSLSVCWRSCVCFLFAFFSKSILICFPCFLFKKRIGINAIIHICMIFPSDFGDIASHSEFICQAYLIVMVLSFPFFSALRQTLSWTLVSVNGMNESGPFLRE